MWAARCCKRFIIFFRFFKTLGFSGFQPIPCQNNIIFCIFHKERRVFLNRRTQRRKFFFGKYSTTNTIKYNTRMEIINNYSYLKHNYQNFNLVFLHFYGCILSHYSFFPKRNDGVQFSQHSCSKIIL